ncbi:MULTISPECIES: inorganic diphosphatase [Weeksella]|uniref:Inorganic pyrophosphatase n=1 Tax=Weeksella virosa (strain ATCC 43766 / DSM 16922 / JCM 21250 / CCUG 30538 / CDC 9751 / IAM 14551 / NBRC 16016 / NCTC 11634 / CL345/78) TaxID=865938 RepID=F0P1W6_WEEVC|nr:MULTISPECIES: inorganic diphosphatase [Weeksella]ADX67676.1 Inorganic pyrophosphatase [Weeksella virosa DSM 16922]MDK7373967.1 inorganic diphosphatase [Weeksella virosa]MDK7674222.1 inorganic diphosphatase [Weeksella virosa]OFM82655.1 inorganic pyrophosphatase [Weeksella sp. HMSC059D05]SUP53974.1 Inorganic pyrophosphatase [Weeksella virosa]
MTFDAIIEIPRGSRNKYEMDHETGMIRFDRVLYSPMFYPADYGFVPDTLGLDGDPLDVLVFLTEPTFPGCLIEVKPIGVLNMSDDKGRDEKIICVPVADPTWNQLENIEDMNSHTLKAVEHFFKTYKDLENKTCVVEGYGDKEQALQIIQEAFDRFVPSQA